MLVTQAARPIATVSVRDASVPGWPPDRVFGLELENLCVRSELSLAITHSPETAMCVSGHPPNIYLGTTVGGTTLW